jgi:hypothetical protein
MAMRPYLPTTSRGVRPKPPGPVEAFLPAIVWRASQCGWIRIDKTEHGHDVWEKPNGERMIIRAGAEPLVPVRPTKRSLAEDYDLLGVLARCFPHLRLTRLI